MDSKLRCVFEMPGQDEDAVVSSQMTGVTGAHEPTQDVYSASVQVRRKPCLDHSRLRIPV